MIVFSEWTTMLDLIEPLIEKRNLKYVRLDGSVLQKKRQGLIHQFQEDPECKLFLTTNAGSTGLNLQAANTVINVDLPWNPAVLEQRIARAHRMGQKNPVHVFILVTENTLEESMLNTLSGKQALFSAALDINSDVNEVNLKGGIDELKKRLEILIKAKPEEAVDESRKDKIKKETELLSRKKKLSHAGGELLGAAFSFISSMLPEQDDTEDIKQKTELFKKHLYECLDKDEDGNLKMTFNLPNKEVLDNMAKSLAKIMNSAGGKNSTQ